MNDLLRLAPTILGFLGGPAGGIAGAGLEWLASKLGASAPTVDAIKTTLQGQKPEDAIALRKIDVEFQEFCIKSGIEVQLAQIAVNQEQAKSLNMFIAGPRPAVMWVCVVALALAYWPKAIVLAAIWTWQASAIVHLATDPAHILLPPFPDLGVTDLIGLLGSILGLGGMRTAEKITKTAGNH